MIYRYRSTSRVAKIEERFTKKHVSGSGDHEVTEPVSAGWWVVDDGSPAYAMQAEPEKPKFGVGAKITFIVEIEGAD